MIREFVADRGDAGTRLDRVLARHLRDVASGSRTRFQHWIDDDRVRVNGTICDRASRRLGLGDRVVVELPDAPRRREHLPEAIPLEVLYEDEWLLAIDKPAGLVVHPTGGHRAGTLFNALLWRARAWPSGQRPGLVHRLDRDTSGIVLVAKDPATHARLARAMGRRAIVKRYLAIVFGSPASRKGQIALGLVRAEGRRPRMVAIREGGRASITAYEVLGRSTAEGAGICMLRCTLLTGRMHQIRAHLVASGTPIVGDPVYGEPRWKGIADPALAEACRALPRQALHAHQVAFAHPHLQTEVVLTSPLPADLRALIGRAAWDADLRGDTLASCPPAPPCHPPG